jgi:hypothetical protein
MEVCEILGMSDTASELGVTPGNAVRVPVQLPCTVMISPFDIAAACMALTQGDGCPGGFSLHQDITVEFDLIVDLDARCDIIRVLLPGDQVCAAEGTAEPAILASTVDLETPVFEPEQLPGPVLEQAPPSDLEPEQAKPPDLEPHQAMSPDAEPHQALLPDLEPAATYGAMFLTVAVNNVGAGTAPPSTTRITLTADHFAHNINLSTPEIPPGGVWVANPVELRPDYRFAVQVDALGKVTESNLRNNQVWSCV